MLTSEQQKIYNVKVPKGGYGYYTLYHGIYDPENDIDERPSYAQTGDLFEPEGSSVVYKATRKNGKTTWAIAEDAQRQSESGEGGSGGGGLPADFPAEGSANANKFLGFDNSGDYAALDAPSGAEKLVVNIRDSGGVTSDKTVAEIVSAKNAGKDVVANVYVGVEGVTAELPLIYALEVQEQGAAVMFSASMPSISESVGENIYTVYGLAMTGSDDTWNSDTVSVGGSFNAPLIVTMTAGATEGQFVGDKTNGEIYTTYISGAQCIVNIQTAGSTFSITGGVFADNKYVFYGRFNGTDIQSVEGNENDYITINVGG